MREKIKEKGLRKKRKKMVGNEEGNQKEEEWGE
jgi:hypothetical protein